MGKSIGRMLFTSVGRWAFGPLGGVAFGALGNSLFPTTLPEKIGPRLTDLMATSSTEGAPRMRGFGTVRMAGNVLWAPGLTEIKTTEKLGGKGGVFQPTTATSQKVTTYNYYSDLAIGFGEGLAEDVLRIWIDEKLVYDKTGSGDVIAIDGLTFRFYTGAEDQEPDPLIVSRENVKDTSAYRGECYIVFEQLPVLEFGNRPTPNINAEIVWSGAVANPSVDTVSALVGGISAGIAVQQIRDWTREYAYEFSVSTPAIRRINTRDLVEDRQALFSDIMAGSSWPTNYPAYGGAVTPGGKLIMSVASYNDTPMILIDPVTMTRLSIWGQQDIAGDWTPVRAPPITKWASVLILYTSVEVERNEYMVGSGFFADGHCVVVRVDQAPEVLGTPNTIGYVWDSQTYLGAGGLGIGARIFPVTLYASRERSNICMLFGGSDSGGGTEVGVGELEIFLSAQHNATNLNSNMTSYKVKNPIDIADIVTGATEYYDIQTVFKDDADDTFIFVIRMTITTYQMFKWDHTTEEVMWSTDITATYNSTFALNQSVVKDNTLGWVKDNGHGAWIDTRTGVLKDADIDFGVTYSGGANQGVWNSRSQSFSVTTSDSYIMKKYNFGRGTSEEVSLATIVAQICEWDRLEASDIDVTDLANEYIPGYAVTQPGATGRAAIEPLQMLRLFDGVESDDVLKFRMRGQSSVRTISEDDLIVVDSSNDDTWVTTDQQEIELPERVTFAYQSRENDYQIATSSAKRVLAPVPVMRSVSRVSQDFTAALDNDDARQSAEKYMYALWIGRTTYKHKLPWSHIDLEPSDVYTVQPSANQSYLVRLESSNLGTDMALDNSAMAEDTGQYVSTIVSAGGTGVPVQTIPGQVPVQLFLLDVPLLRNFDELPNRIGAPLYYGIGAYHDGDSARANIYKSSGDSVNEIIGRRIEGVAWGGTANAMPDPPVSPFMTDNTSELRVYMQDGGATLASITELQMLNGGNAAALLKANGEVELINFRDVSDNSDGSYILSGFLRGRRGTDTMTNSHTVGETFVVLNNLTWDTTNLSLEELNTARYYKAVPDGQQIEESLTYPLTSELRPLMPYAVRNVEAEREMDDDILLTWYRRDRLGTDLVDSFEDQPLSEDSELYKVYIYDGPAGTLVRTVTGLTSATYTYTAANQGTDGLSLTAPAITVKVVQVSGQVGEGFSQEITIEI